MKHSGAIVSTESTHDVRFDFRPDIEGLRGLAVMLVVAFHVGIRGVSGGFVGVDVFFVISGFLITRLLVDEVRRTGTISLAAFYARRVRRLIPAGTVVLLATLVLAAVALPPLQQIQTATSVRSAGAYASNVYFASLASDYFSGDVKSNPVLHTWSLSVEEQFYLLWPVLLLWVARHRDEGGEVRWRFVACALTLIGALSFGAACRYTATNHSLAFYGTPLRAWEFAVGGIASVLVSARTPFADGTSSQSMRTTIGWSGLTAVLASASVYSPATDFPGLSALLPVVGTAMVLFAGTTQEIGRVPGVGRLLAIAPARWIGRRSYSWYLWHWPVLVIGTSLMATPGLPARVCLAGLALVLADLTYRYVEVPMRTGPIAADVRTADWRILRRAALAATVVVSASVTAQMLAGTAARQPLQRAFTAAASDIPRAYADACVNASGNASVRVCTYGDSASATVVALFGDSHAVQWLPAVDSMAKTRGWQLLVIGKSRCATADVPVYVPETSSVSADCAEWRAHAIDTLIVRGAKLVLLSNTGWYVRDSLRRGFPGVTAGEWRDGMLRTLRRLRDSGIPAVVIQDTPLLNANVPICLARSGWLGRVASSCGTDRGRAINHELADAEQDVVTSVSADRVIDLTDVLCQPTHCPAIVNGIVAYSDREHLTASLSRTLVPALSRALDESGVAVPVSRHRPAVQHTIDGGSGMAR